MLPCGKTMAKLTVKAVEYAKPGPARREVPDGLISGLYLVVQPSGSKSWAYRYRANSKTRKLTLGRYPKIGLAGARELAQKAELEIRQGRDPADKAPKREEKTVEALARDLSRSMPCTITGSGHGKNARASLVWNRIRTMAASGSRRAKERS